MLRSFREKDFSYPFTIWIIIILWYLIFVYNFFEVAHHKSQDFISSQAFYLFSSPPEEARQIAIVAIDEDSRRSLNLKWPWPRSITAELVRNIISYAPSVIGLDIVFAGTSEASDDEELASVFTTHPNIILAYNLGKESIELPLSSFLKSVRGVGFVTKPLERSKISENQLIDKVVRNLRVVSVDREANIGFSMEAELAAAYLGIPRNKISHNVEEGIFLGDKLFIPSSRQLTPINYLAHYNEFVTVSATSVLDKKVNPEIFKDKIVLVGATDHLVHDEHLTPLGSFPGVAILANSLLMILSQRFIYSLSPMQTFLIIFILGIILLLINKRFSFAISSIFTFLILAMLFIGSIYLRAKDIQLDYFSVFFLSFLAYIISNVYKYSYLSYMKNKLRTLAIQDPLTKFYNLRYFLLKLDQQLKRDTRNLAFFALSVANYRTLTLDLNFEESKFLMKLLSEYIQTGLEKRFKKVDFACIAQDTIGVVLWGRKKELVDTFCRDFLEELRKTEFKVEGKSINVSLKGVLIYKPRAKHSQASEIIYNMHAAFKNIQNDPKEYFMSLDIEERLWQGTRSPLAEDVLDFLASDIEERNKDLESAFKELSICRKEAEEAYFEVIRSLIKALEEKDTFTQGHSKRVANYAKKIAIEIGLDDEESQRIYKAALLHDIGKIGIPEVILHKKGPLSVEERAMINKHTIMGVDILKPLKPFEELLPIIFHHHEHIDGTGYPHGLSGDMIPRGARIVAVADAFDAITSGRGYKEGTSAQEAIKILEKQTKIYSSGYIQALKKVLNLE